MSFHKILTSVAYSIKVKHDPLNKSSHGKVPLFPNISAKF